jgi:LysM repeat protein
MDTTFRSKTTTGGSTESIPSGSEPTRGTEAKAEVPFLDYQQEPGQTLRWIPQQGWAGVVVTKYRIAI